MVAIVTPDQSAQLAALQPPAVEFAMPPLRKRLPAFGRLLLQARRCGEHPSEITVVYGDQWRAVSAPKVCVRPAEYVPGQVDWRVVAGVKVFALDLGDGLGDFDVQANRYGPFYSLIAELVAMDAYVVVRYAESGQWREQEADALAYACRWARRWPYWWSDDLERRQRAAFHGWMGDLERKIQRNFERGPEK
jgi:hypothetical protein